MTSSPDFIVIGAMKCGTSTVCAYLEDHADVFMVPHAEPNFFSQDAAYAKGVRWYEETYFAANTAGLLAGEGSNNYAAVHRFPETVARMAAYKPDLKLIYIVRHPLERIVSDWLQRRSDALDNAPPTLDRAVLQDPDRYLGQSLYWDVLQQYQAAFGADRIFVGFMEDLKDQPEEFFARICNFLGIEPMAEIRRGHQNKSHGKPIPTPLYSMLNRFPGVAQLKGFLPQRLRRKARRKLLSRPVVDRPRFSPSVLRDLRRQIKPQMRVFLRDQGKPEDLWTLDQD